jgi:hypothetical protein
MEDVQGWREKRGEKCFVSVLVPNLGREKFSATFSKSLVG